MNYVLWNSICLVNYKYRKCRERLLSGEPETAWTRSRRENPFRESNPRFSFRPASNTVGISAKLYSTRSRVRMVDMKSIHKRGCWIFVRNDRSINMMLLEIGSSAVNYSGSIQKFVTSPTLEIFRHSIVMFVHFTYMNPHSSSSVPLIF